MRIADHLTANRVVVIEATTKAQALDALMNVLARSVPRINREALAEALWKREGLMSTGIGTGLAIPHVRMAGVSEVAMAVGVSRAGIADYESLDNQPVHIILLIVAPQGQHEAYIRLLALVTEVLKDAETRRSLTDACEPDKVYAILTGAGR